jgi:hypothetical protein
MIEPDPDLLLLARVVFAAEPEGDASGAKAAIGRLALKLYVLEQCGKGRDSGHGLLQSVAGPGGHDGDGRPGTAAAAR